MHTIFNDYRLFFFVSFEAIRNFQFMHILNWVWFVIINKIKIHIVDIKCGDMGFHSYYLECGTRVAILFIRNGSGFFFTFPCHIVTCEYNFIHFLCQITKIHKIHLFPNWISEIGSGTKKKIVSQFTAEEKK